MKLFKYEGYKVVISEEAFALKPFRVIWNRDRSVKKDTAITEMAYIYFMSDPRSDYQYIIDEDERSKAIMEGEGMPPKWKPDKAVKEAMEFYESFKPTSALLLEDTRVVVDNVRKTLRSFSFEDMEEKDRVNALKSITAVVASIPKLIKDLDEAEKAIKADMQAASGTVRGQKEKALLEDGLI